MVSILGIDTSAGACSAALWRDGAAGAGVIAAERQAMARGHAEALMPMIERVLASAGCGYRELVAVAVVAGPGAFTGLRIGLAAARGIALAAGIPAVGVTAFAAVAAGIPAASRAGRAVAVAIDTKRGDVYLQCFDARLEPVAAGRVVAMADIAAALPAGPVYVAGDGTPLLRPVLAEAGRDAVYDSDPAPPDAGVVAALGAAQLAGAQLGAAHGARMPPPEPIYLRAPEATPLALQGKATDRGRRR